MTRQTSGLAGGWLLLFVGLGLVAQAATTGSFGFALLNLPLVAAGAAVLKRWPFSIGFATIVALIYAAFWGFVATTPLRSLTPAPGELRPPLDALSVGLALALLVALVLLVLALWARRRNAGDR